MPAVAAFVVGLVVGAVLVAVFAEDGSSGAVAAPTASTTASPSTSPLPSEAAADILVGPSCLAAINEAQEAYNTLTQVGDAARRLDAARLDQIVQQAQAVQRQLQRDIPACHATVRLPGGATPSGTATVVPPAQPSPGPS